MGIVSAVRNLFGRKKNVLQASEKLVPNAAQKAILAQVAYMFDRTTVQYMTYHATANEEYEGHTDVHVLVIDNHHTFKRGIHTDNQDTEALLWTKPWDENEHGEDGKNEFKRVGVSFARTTAAVDMIVDARGEIAHYFNIDIEAGDQLQFDSQYYWIAKK
jgi:hypothetical protein